MRTKQDVIDAARRAGSTSDTFRGAYRYLRTHPRHIDRMGSRGLQIWANPRKLETLPRGVERYRVLGMSADLWRGKGAERTPVSPREAWMAVRHRERWLAREERIAREVMAGGRYSRRWRKIVPLLDRQQYEIEAASQCALLGLPAMPEAEEMAAVLTAPFLRRAAVELEHAWPYRRSTSSWAGGEHSVTVRLAHLSSDCGAVCSTERVWSRNGKWSGSNSDAVIITDLATLMEFPTLMTRDGLALCRAEKIAPREWRVKWIEQSTGVSLKTVDGWLIRGYHVRAVSIEQARKKASAARKQAVAATIRERQAKLTKRAGLAGVRGIFLATEDSIAAGNCQSATTQFAAQIWREIGASGPCAVRADVVLMARDDYYTRRALGAALARSEAR